MLYNDLKQYILSGGYDEIFSKIYCGRDMTSVHERYISLVEKFCEFFGFDHDMYLFSNPSRSEISGNHTDHNLGRVCAASVDLDIIAVAAKNNENKVVIKSYGFDADELYLSDLTANEKYFGTSLSLIRGIADRFNQMGYGTGGFFAYTVSDIPVGAGLSTSAAFSDITGTIFNHFYNDGKIDAVEIAKISKYAENVHFGKPSGLMDQIACAVGGFAAIDFEDPASPVVTPLFFDLEKHGYELYIVETGASHANLTDEYAAIPFEMKSVAKIFGKDVLRGLTEADLYEKFAEIREKCGDRALLRAIHFVNEDIRAGEIVFAMQNDDIDAFLAIIKASGDSSAKYLQNSCVAGAKKEQAVSVALAVAENILKNGGGTCRVHGGGFAGTIQAFVPSENAAGLAELLDGVFGKGATHILKIRPQGAICTL